MFPSSLPPVLMIVGAIWIVQGLGIANTGSFMDGEAMWALIGAIVFVAGALLMLLSRRRRPPS
ncbi:MAG: hypothetical protein M3164_01780 [Actinomycetota bacterium]|nr:hypothetical protein [Actinomycetota bacterium]